ncbi:DNA-directed RNA polymerase subunit omega [bacterium]|nr:MAG: DNA-directed RNA polymerase subunit omega [bacterium]
MEETKFIYDVKIEELSKYELVLLVARRARQINELRIMLEKKHETRLIEKEKPTVVALREILDGNLSYEFRKPGQEQFQRGMKKTV